MAKFSRLEVYQAMINTGMVPVFYHADTEVAKQVVKLATKVEYGFSSLPTEVILLMKCSQNS